jgi:phosphatidylinositol glycan class A protein
VFDPWIVTALLLGLETAVANLRSGNVVPPWDCHRRVASLYNWMDVARRTETVYHQVAGEKSKTLGSQLRSYMASGVLPFLLIITLAHFMLCFLDWMVPRQVSISFTTLSVLQNVKVLHNPESLL